MSWKAEVIADNSGKWVGNELTFVTKAEAEAEEYVRDRWTSVRETRTVETDKPATCRMDKATGRAVPL